MPRGPFILTPLILICAFLLLLLISLSIPIINTISLLELRANLSAHVMIFNVDADAVVKFGVWGYCISHLQAGVEGETLGVPGLFCSKAGLGFTFDNTIAKALNVSFESLQGSLSKALSAILVLHPVVCGLTFIALVLTVLTQFRPTRAMSGFSTFITFLTALITTLIFLIDVIFVAVVRKNVNNATDGDISVNWGNATWMALTAAVLLWVAVVCSCFNCCSIRRQSRKMSGKF